MTEEKKNGMALAESFQDITLPIFLPKYPPDLCNFQKVQLK